MKHHFRDLLDRSGNYWTMVPNRERYRYRIEDVLRGSKEVTVVTISKDDEEWDTIHSLPNLEELTLHEPSKAQLEALSRLWNLKRLRITHARPKNIEFIRSMVNLEELVLEYVSGFSDLSPLSELPKLTSVHLENLRRVSDFGGLSGLKCLRYLKIDGTFDWKQPIADFEFLHGLPNLEVLALGSVIIKAPYPALLPVLTLQHLKKISVSWTMLEAEEYALLEVGMPHVDGAVRGPYTRFARSTVRLPNTDVRAHLPDDVIRQNHPEVTIYYNGERHIKNPDDTWLEFTGKRAGKTKVGSPKEKEKCSAYAEKYEQMKDRAKQVIAKSA